MNTREQRRGTFDAVAELYERHRPGYPAQLIDDVVRLSGIPERGHILEIGCGPGKASLAFAERGYRMTCLEPGAKLAQLAAAKLAAYPGVRVEVTLFEDWRSTEGDVSLVMAAQSFHFVDPETALQHAARALRPNGAIAIFGNHPQRGDSELDRRLQQLYERIAPELAEADAKAEAEVPLEDRIDACGLFGTVLMTRYPWRAVYPADDYAALMETQSGHRLLPTERRTRLLAAIRDAIVEHGGSIAIDYVTRLHLARRCVTAA